MTAHGVDTRPLFADDVDRGRFLGILSDVTRERDWRCLAFCLMTTHYHLLLEERSTPLWKSMHLLNSRYGCHVNIRNSRRGHVFEGRYRDRVVTRDEHFHHAIRYLARNPCEAGLCSDPAAWPWSSYAALVGAARAWSFVSSALVLSFFAPQRHVAVERVRRFVEQVPGTVPGTWVRPGARRP